MNLQEHSTVGEIAAGSTAAAGVLEKYGIDYCCGGKRLLDDACREKGLSPDGIRNEIAEAVTAVPAGARDWTTAPLSDLIRHIVRTHHEFLKLELPRIGQRVQRVVQAHGHHDPEALLELEDVYRTLWQEMDLHMHKEELMLFPAIEHFEAATQSGSPLPPSPFGSIANPITVMEREHDSAGDALARIRVLTRDYEVPAYACSTYRAMLLGLQALEADLHTHVHLENNILFPRVIALEQQFSRTN